MGRTTALLLLALAAGVGRAAGALPEASPEAAAVSTEMRALFGAAGSMAPGLPGNSALEAEMARRFAASGFTNGVLRFSAPVFTPGATTVLRQTNAAPTRLYAMHPTLYRPGNFAETDFSADLVYLGRGEPADLTRVDGAELNGAVALMEFDCGNRWQAMLRFGLRGFVFIGRADYDYVDSYGKIYNTEVATPRFFVPAKEGADLKAACLGAGARAGAVRVTVHAEPSRVADGELGSPWVLIPGRDPELSKEIVLFTARLDANSVVPELATGAQVMVNPYLLLKLLEDFKAQRPARSVLLAGVNAHTQDYLGERILAWHLLADSDGLAKLRDEIAKDMRAARLYDESYSQLKLDPVTLDPGRLFAGVELLSQLEQARPSATNAVLAPSAFNEADYRAAIERAVVAMKAQEQGSFFSRRMQDARMAAALAQERAWVEDLRSVPHDELVALAGQCQSVYEDEKRFESWRSELDSTSGQRLATKKEMQNAAMRAKNVLQQERMHLFQDKGLSESERQARAVELDRKLADATRVLVMFNKIDFGVGRRQVRYRDIAGNEAQRTLLVGFRDSLTRQFSFWQGRHRERLEADAACDGIRQALGGGKVALAISLEMAANSDKIGFCAASPGFSGTWAVNFGKYVTGVASALDTNRTDRVSPFVDCLNPGTTGQPLTRLHSTDSAVRFFIAARGGDQGCGTPALAIKNAFSGPGPAFSPEDSIERLDAQRVSDQQRWLREYLPLLVNAPALTARENLDVTQLGHGSTFDATRGLWSSWIGTFAMDSLTATVVPEKAVPNSLVVLYNKMGMGQFLLDGDVVNAYAGLTDSTGKTVIYGMPDTEGMAPTAYQLDADGRRVVEALDKGRIQTTLQMNSNIARDPSKTLPLFPCREFPLYDRVDPTLVGVDPIAVTEVWPKSGSSKSDPPRFGISGLSLASTVWSHTASGPAAVYLEARFDGREPDSLMLITDSRRFAINATAKDPEGVGFASAEAMGADFFAHAARDMDTLNTYRRGKLKGVENSLVEQFLTAGKRALVDMDAARAARNPSAFRLATYRALGCEVKAYLQLSGMNADMLKAIILYMALMLPFCFFVQKLLFDLDKLQHELLAFSACFVLMYTLFRFIHPAFAVAQTPEAIFIAFVLGAVGAFVTMVMHTRFKAEMRLIFGKTVGLGDADYSTVGSTAMMVGIHNMRRRRVRTALTTATVVLVVFTMLTFSSVSQRLDPTLIRKAADAPYTGLFYHWPAGKNLDEDSVAVLKNIFADRADVVVRRALALGEAWPVEVQAEADASKGAVAPPPAGGIKSLVGLPANDRVFAMSMPLLAGRHFSGPDAREILLPSKTAEALNLSARSVGHTVLKIRGTPLALVGIVDDQRLRLVRDLNPNLPFLPFRTDQAIGGTKQDATTLEIAAEDVSAIVADTASMAILPDAVAAALGAQPHSVSIRFPDETVARPDFQIWEEMDRLLTITHARFYIGSEREFKATPGAERLTRPGIYFVNSNYRTSVGGLSRLVIPLLIAGLIILNTMLGTVYERKGEIAIYNAIGLNPTHIFMFFLAEAFVYSFIGSVGGYLVGQSLAMLLQSLGLIRDIGVNFSSLMVVYAILFTIALVLLSTIYPALVATRTAVPSGKRRWSMPPNADGAMQVAFPFIYEGDLAPGVMYYLYEDFLSCTEKSLSSLIAEFEGKSLTTDAEGRPVYTLTYLVALTPFDLGVTQRVRLVASYEARVKSYRLSMALEHVSGLHSNWVSLNRFFLERMRKFLMVWRNMEPSLYAWYSESGQKVFRDEPLPPRPADTAA
jgi:hypothetical protein